MNEQKIGELYHQCAANLKRSIEVEMHDGEEHIQVSLKRFDDTMDSINVEQHYYANSDDLRNILNGLDPLRKLYLDKCNENMTLQ